MAPVHLRWRADVPRSDAHQVVGALHVHSEFSHDGVDSLERLREFALERGIAWIGLTDHAEDFDAARYQDYAARCAGLSDARVRLVPGLEFRFRGRAGLHLLALGLAGWVEPATPDDFMAQASERARLTVLAHPVLCDYIVPEAVRAGIDGVEIWNATYNTRYLPDPRAIRLLHALRARRPAVMAVAGLDQHDSRNDRGVRVVTPADAGDPFVAIRTGRSVNVGRTMRLDAAAGLTPLQLRALGIARWTLDRLERAHAWAKRRRAAPRA